MSWLGKNFNEGFSSLKGQLVSLTKDVLDEDEGQAEVPAEYTGVNNYLKQIEALQYEKAELESRLTATELESRRKVSTLEKHVEKFENENEMLKEAAKELKREEQHGNIEKDGSNVDERSFGKSQKFVSEENDFVEKLRSQLKLLSNKFDQAQNEKKRMHSDMQELDSQHQQALDILHIKKKQLESDLGKATVQLSQSDAKIQDDDSNMNKLMSENEKLIAEIENLEAKLDASLVADSTVTELKNKGDIIVNLQMQLEKANENIKDLSHTKLSTEEKVTILTKSFSDLQTANTELNAEIEDIRMSSEVIKKKVEETQKEMSCLFYKAEESNLKNMKYEAVMEEQCAENEILRKKNLEEITRNRYLFDEFSYLVKEKWMQKDDDPKQLSAVLFLEQLKQNCQFIGYDELPSSAKDSEIAHLRCERDKLQEESESRLQDLNFARDIVEAVESDKLALEGECEELRDQLEELQYDKREEPEGSLSRTLTTIEEEDTDPSEDQVKSVQEDGRLKLADELNSKKDRTGHFWTEVRSLHEKYKNLQMEMTTIQEENAVLKSAQSDCNQISTVDYIDRSSDDVVTRDSSACQSEGENMFSDKNWNLLRSQVIFKDDQIDNLRSTISEIGELFGVNEFNLRETYCAAKRESIHFKNKIQEKNQTIDSLLKNSEDFDLRFTDIQQQCDDAVQLKDFLQTCIEDTKKKNQQLSMEISNMTVTVKKSGTNNIKLENKLEELERLLQEEKNKNVEHATQEYLTIEPLKRENIQLIEARQELITQSKSIKANNELLNKEIDELSVEKSQLIINYEKSLTIRNEECFQKNKSIADLKTELDSLKDSLIKSDSSNKQEFISFLATIKNLEIAGSNLKEKNDSLSEELKLNCSEQQSVLQQKVEELTIKNEEDFLKSQRALREENVRLSEAVKSLTEDNVEANMLNRQLNELILNDENNNKISHLNQCLETKTKELLEAHEMLSKNDSELRRLEEAINVLKSQDEQLLMANSAFNSQYEVQTKELLGSQEKERHLHTECDRLKDHLISIEESHTNEALQAEQREAALKQTIAKLHEKMASHSNLYSSANQKNADKVETLQESLKSAVLGRDEALQQLHLSEESSLQNQESLQSLNQVLLDFQKSYNKDVREATEKDRRQLEKERSKSFELQQDINVLQRKIEDLENSSSASLQLRKEIQTNQATILDLQSQVNGMQQVMKKGQEEVQLLQSSSEVKVEKNLVRNLFVGYFASAPDKQCEVLHIIAQILDFSSSERIRTGLDTNPSSWMTSVANFLAPPASNIRVTSKVDVLDHSSLSRAFIRFLEDESALRPYAKLPAIEMAEESNQKAFRKAQSKASKPFSATTSGEQFSPLIDTPLPTLQPVVLQPVNSQQTTEESSNVSEQKYLKDLLTDDKNSSEKS